MIRVLIADDHAVVRQGLKQILGEATDIDVVGEATSSAEVLEAARALDWDVLVLDLAMPGRSGFDVLMDLQTRKPGQAILVLSMYAEDQYARRVLKAGASGYLTKESAPQELLEAIRRVVGGHRYISQSMAEKLASEIGSPPDQDPHESLSDREFQVMRLLGAGKTVSQIAADLSLSVKTISTYRARVLQKLGLHTNGDVIHYTIQHGLLEGRVGPDRNDGA